MFVHMLDNKVFVIDARCEHEDEFWEFIEIISAANLAYVAYDEKGTRSVLNCVCSSLEDLPDRCLHSTLKMGHDHCNSHIFKTSHFRNCL